MYLAGVKVGPEEREQFREKLQDIADLVSDMVAVEALREGLTVEEFNRTYAFEEEWYHTCIKDGTELGEACICEACLQAKAKE
jgi:hypothetical protein